MRKYFTHRLRTNIRPRIILLTYSDDRFGHKKGKFRETQEAINQSVIHGPSHFGITHIKAWNIKEFQKTKFYKKNQQYFNKNRFENGNAWKPYIAYELMKNIGEGDMILYTDCNSYSVIRRDLKPLIETCEENDSVIHQWGDQQQNWTKRDAFVYMKCDTKKQHEAVAIQNTWFMLKRTSFNFNLVKEWLSYNMDERIASYLKPDTCGADKLEGFREHRGDQSIMSILCHKYDILTIPGLGGYKNRHINNFIDHISSA